MLKIVSLFKTPKTELVPLFNEIELLEPPSPDATPDQIESFKKNFEVWESRSNEILEENKLRFEKAKERIKLCAFLQGFTDPFAMRPILVDHYSWCPQKEWTKSSGFALNDK